jgi:hypothetical protein
MENITSKIEEFLKKENYRFITYSNGLSDSIELFFGSSSGHIQIEKPSNVGDNESLVQVFDIVDDDGESLFLNIIDRAERNIDEVFNSIEDLKEHVKVFTKKSSQIESYIEKINDICDELGIPPETFITVNYKFK